MHREPPAEPYVRWLARGWREFPALARDICDFSDVRWSFPAWNYYANPYVRVEPRLLASLTADAIVLRRAADQLEDAQAELAQARAQLAEANATIKVKNDKIAALELAATAGSSWQNYGGSSSSSSTSWRGHPEPEAYKSWEKPKGGWLNKMVAMLAALWHDDEGRVVHLCRV